MSRFTSLFRRKRMSSIFGGPSNDDHQWLREELTAIRTAVNGINVDLSAIKLKMDGFVSDQRRLEVRVDKVERDVGDVVRWRTEQRASWRGPAMILGGIAAMVPILGIVIMVLQIFDRIAALPVPN